MAPEQQDILISHRSTRSSPHGMREFALDLAHYWHKRHAVKIQSLDRHEPGFTDEKPPGPG
jgi:hypothetical protein